MNAKILKNVERVAAKVGYVFLASADATGWPHVAAARRLAITPERHALVTEWFCPGTTANLQEILGFRWWSGTLLRMSAIS